MRRSRPSTGIFLIAWLLASLAGIAVASQSADESAVENVDDEKVDDESEVFQQITSGVSVALQPHDLRFNDSNSVLIETERELILVDTQSNRETVEVELDALEERARESGKSLRFLINTHWHSDHTQGNQVVIERFGKSVIVLGHETLVEEVPERAGAYIREQIERLADLVPKAREQLEKGLSLAGEEMSEEQQAQQRIAIYNAETQLEQLRTTELVPPTLTYRGSMTLHRESGDIELLHFRAHTRGDTVIFLPRQKVLITGDLLDDLPYAGHGYPRSWLAALDQLAELDFDQIVPGHGPVFRDREPLERLRSLLRDVIEQTDGCDRLGLDLEACRARVSLESHREDFVAEDDALADRTFDQFMPELVTRAWRETQETTP